jgi:hypothetical protein
MSVPAAGVTVIQGDVRASVIPSKEGKTLRGEQIGRERKRDEWRQLGKRDEQAAPGQVGA